MAAAGAGQPAFPVPVVLALIIIGGLLQVASRFLVFDASSGHLAADSGQATPPWLLAVALPLLAAGQLLISRRNDPVALAVSAGLVTGAALCQLDQALAVTAAFHNPDIGGSEGPGYWASVLGTLVLLACAVVMMSGRGFRDRPALLRNWRAAVATLVVLGALVIRLRAFSPVTPWFMHNEPAILLAAACLPLTSLRLNRVQRLLGLTAVTIFGPWVCGAHVYAMIYGSYPLDANSALVGVVSALVSVTACYLAQLAPRQQPVRT